MCVPDKIEGICDLEKIAVTLNNELGEQLWWRGHCQENWELKPSIWRKEQKHPGYVKQEIAYLNHFQGRAICQHESRRTPQTEVEWLFLAQHFRLPTRLLDWTESPLVALYFAVIADDADKESGEKDACLWALSPRRLNQKFSNEEDPKNAQDGLISIDEGIVKAIASESFVVKKPACPHCGAVLKVPFPKVLALQPWESNERIIAQSGRFTLHSSRDNLQTLGFQESYLRKIIIPQAAKAILKGNLEVFGIRRWNIFPDLENLAKGLSNSDFVD
ncbi:MAG: FRG domain-containing protein [Terracidiphilus sp.]